MAIEKLGLRDRVHLLGFRSDGARVLKSLDLLFFPSQMEGASVTIREAMALGKPVITMNTPGSVESLDGHGWVVEDGSPDQAVGHLQEIASGGDRVQEKIARARQSARARFSIEGTVDGTIQVYEAVLAGKHLE